MKEWIKTDMDSGFPKWKFCHICGQTIFESRVYVTTKIFPRLYSHIKCMLIVTSQSTDKLKEA